MTRFAAAFLPLAILAGCATSHPRPVVATPTPPQSAMFDQVKSLQGEWMATDDKGNQYVAAVFSVTAGGSAVREIMLPGTQHEMTNMYHMDGPTLVMTHYCAAGNQPRMRAVAGEPGTLDFKFDSVTNLTAQDETYMGSMVMKLEGPNTVVTHWTSYKDGVVSDHTADFRWTRKQ